MRRWSLFVVLVMMASIFALSVPFASNVRATTLFVGGAGTGNLSSIQAAIDQAASGDTVYVFPGTYHENIVIHKSLSLIGAGSETTVIDGDGTTDVIYVTGYEVEIAGFTIANSSSGSDMAGIQIFDTAHCSISGNLIAGNRNGIYVSYTNRTFIANNTIRDNYRGIRFLFTNNSTVVDNRIDSNNRSGIRLGRSPWNTISYNEVTSSSRGIDLQYDSDHNQILDNEVTFNGVGVYLYSSSNNSIVGNNASSNSGRGVDLSYSHHNEVVGNVLSNNSWGVDAGHSSHLTITHNTVTSNERFGIYIYSSGNNTIAQNEISGSNEVSLMLLAVHDSTMAENDISLSGRYGMHVEHSNNNVITDNVVTSSNNTGIYVELSENNTLTGNTMLENGIRIRGFYLEQWNTHEIDTTNTVNLRPVIYWKDVQGGTVPAGAGQVMLANCSGVVVEGQDITDTSVGIQFGYSSGITVNGNTVSSMGYYGIYSGYSSDSVISNNTLSSNGGNGIEVEESRNITVSSNTVLTSYWSGIELYYSEDSIVANNTIYWNLQSGIRLERSDDNAIMGNTIYWNDRHGIYVNFVSNYNTISNNTIYWNKDHGIYIWSAYGNRIFHNSLLNNTIQAFDTVDTPPNQWDNGYPSGGNYWSDYVGVDERSGPDQDQTGGDGIGDTPYPIEGELRADRYPLLAPLTPPPPPPANLPPTCAVTPPAPGEVMSGTFTINGTAADEDGIVERVEIRIDEGSWIEVMGTAWWSYDWDTTTVADGNYTIHARSHDGTSYSGEVSVTVVVDNPEPHGDVITSIFEEVWFWMAVVLLIVVSVAVLLSLWLSGKRSKGEG